MKSAVLLVFLVGAAYGQDTSASSLVVSVAGKMKGTKVAKPTGCKIQGGPVLGFGERYTTAYAEYVCERHGKSWVLTPVACILNGTKVTLGHGQFHGMFFYVCSAQGVGIGLEIVGCKDDRYDSVVPLKGLFRSGDYEYMCATNGKVGLEVGMGCHVPDFGLIEIGQVYKYRTFFYQCSRHGSRGVRAEVIGCADKKGQLVNFGQKYIDNHVLYECKKADDQVISNAPIGCAFVPEGGGQVYEFPIGSSWYEVTNKRFGYKKECVRHDWGIEWKIVKCTAKVGGSDVELDIGCGRLLGNELFTCQSDKQNVLAQLESAPSGQSGADRIAQLGLRSC